MNSHKYTPASSEEIEQIPPTRIKFLSFARLSPSQSLLWPKVFDLPLFLLLQRSEMSYREVRTCESPSSKTLKSRLRIIISVLAEDFRDFWYIIYANSYGKKPFETISAAFLCSIKPPWEPHVGSFQVWSKGSRGARRASTLALVAVGI